MRDRKRDEGEMKEAETDWRSETLKKIKNVEVVEKVRVDS